MPLEDKIKEFTKVSLIFGHGISLKEDGSIIVQFDSDGKDYYSCVCLREADSPMPESYCYCCCHHIQHHLETALGQKTDYELLTSALTTNGEKSCVMEFTVI